MNSVVATQYARKMTLGQIAHHVAESSAALESAAARDAIAREMLAQQGRGERMDQAAAWAKVTE
jgi:hypothetical protein